MKSQVPRSVQALARKTSLGWVLLKIFDYVWPQVVAARKGSASLGIEKLVPGERVTLVATGPLTKAERKDRARLDALKAEEAAQRFSRRQVRTARKLAKLQKRAARQKAKGKELSPRAGKKLRATSATFDRLMKPKKKSVQRQEEIQRLEVALAAHAQQRVNAVPPRGRKDVRIVR